MNKGIIPVSYFNTFDIKQNLSHIYPLMFVLQQMCI